MTDSNWKSYLHLVMQLSAEAGVSTDTVIQEVYRLADSGAADGPLYTLDEYTRMVDVQPLIDLDPRWKGVAIYAPIPMFDGDRVLTPDQIGTIRIQCQVDRNGAHRPAFGLGFDNGSLVSWRAARIRIPPSGLSDAWKDLGLFKDKVTIKTRFNRMGDLIAWAAERQKDGPMGQVEGWLQMAATKL